MGEVTKKGFVNYRHIRVPGEEHTLGAVTLRIEVDNDNDAIKVSWAVCNQRDNFDKSLGRKIAEESGLQGRFVQGQYLRNMTLAHNAFMQIDNALHCRIDDALRCDITILVKKLAELL